MRAARRETSSRHSRLQRPCAGVHFLLDLRELEALQIVSVPRKNDHPGRGTHGVSKIALVAFAQYLRDVTHNLRQSGELNPPPPHRGDTMLHERHLSCALDTSGASLQGATHVPAPGGTRPVVASQREERRGQNVSDSGSPRSPQIGAASTATNGSTTTPAP